MEDEMDHSNNNFLDSFPPGYRFLPDNHELIAYLRIKVAGGYILPGLFHDVNIYNHTPQQLYEKYGREGQEATYFFSPRKKKYPKGRRPDRTVRIEPNESVPDGKIGFWKANGKDHSVRFRGIEIGTKRNLAYNEGKPNANEKKTNWLMQEFILSNASRNNAAAADESAMHLDDWVLCKIYYNELKKTRKKRVANHGDTEQQGVQNSNVPQSQSQPQPMNQNGQLAAYPSLNNINAENPLMALAAATGYSNHIGLMHDQYDGLMSTTPNLPNNNVAAQYYWPWEAQQMQDGDFNQPAIMPAMEQEDDGFMMNMPPVQHDNHVHPMNNSLMPPSSASSSSSLQEEAEINYYSMHLFSVATFMQLQNESMMPPSDTSDSTSGDTGQGGV